MDPSLHPSFHGQVEPLSLSRAAWPELRALVVKPGREPQPLSALKNDLFLEPKKPVFIGSFDINISYLCIYDLSMFYLCFIHVFIYVLSIPILSSYLVIYLGCDTQSYLWKLHEPCKALQRPSNQCTPKLLLRSGMPSRFFFLRVAAGVADERCWDFVATSLRWMAAMYLQGLPAT